MPKDTQLARAAAGMCIVNHQSEQSLSLCLLAPLGSGLDDPFYIILDEGQGNESIRVLNNFYFDKKKKAGSERERNLPAVAQQFLTPYSRVEPTVPCWHPKDTSPLRSQRVPQPPGTWEARTPRLGSLC